MRMRVLVRVLMRGGGRRGTEAERRSGFDRGVGRGVDRGFDRASAGDIMGKIMRNAIMALLFAAAAGMGTAAPAAWPEDDVLFVGHSLVSWTLPDMLRDAARGAGGRGRVDAQIINGAPLAWSWEHSAEAEGVDARAVLPRGDYEILVLTEAVPLDNHLRWSDTNGYAKRFYDLAADANPNARVHLYESWHDIRSGAGVDIEYDDGDGVPWRTRIDQDLPKWESVVDHVNAERAPGQPEMLLVPAGQAMARMHDEIARGAVPGLGSIAELFSDDIHPNDLGFYFVAMVHYAALYGRSPAGLKRALRSRHGTPYAAPSAALAAAMQRIAWETVCAYPRSGVACR